MPETSVIIPTYNRRHFLQQAVESVLAQSYRDFELIVIDDGSTDGTAEYAASTAGDFHFLRQNNAGPSAARNTGIARAQGKFITFLDSDDLWKPKKLEHQLRFMKQSPEAVVCYTDEIWIRRGVRVNQRKKHRKHSGWIFKQCIPLCIVSPSSVLMRREFFEETGLFDQTLPACEDYDLWLRAALRFPFHCIAEKLVVKRGGHDDQLSSAWGLDRYRVRALLKILDDPRLTHQTRRLVLEAIDQKCRILERGFRKHGRKAEADYYLNLLGREELKLLPAEE